MGKCKLAALVLEDMSREIQIYKLQQRKVKERESKNVCGCIYFLLVYFLQKFALEDDVPRREDAIKHWNDKAVNDRLKLEKESCYGILFSHPNYYTMSPSMWATIPGLEHLELQEFYDKFNIKFNNYMAFMQKFVRDELLKLQSKMVNIRGEYESLNDCNDKESGEERNANDAHSDENEIEYEEEGEKVSSEGEELECQEGNNDIYDIDEDDEEVYQSKEDNYKGERLRHQVPQPTRRSTRLKIPAVQSLFAVTNITKGKVSVKDKVYMLCSDCSKDEEQV